jgi:hypothetical protein
LTYNGSDWKWFPEKDYRYFTGPGGLVLPHVCEDRTTYGEDGVIDPNYEEEETENSETDEIDSDIAQKDIRGSRVEPICDGTS